MFGSANILKLPDIINECLKIKNDDYLYAQMKDEKLVLSKVFHNQAVKLYVAPDFGLKLTTPFAEQLGLQIGSVVRLSLEDNELTIYKSNVVQIYTPDSNKERLIDKLKREFDEMPTTPDSELIEDIYMFLILKELEDDIVVSLLEKPNLLKSLLFMFLDDSEFRAFFESKLSEIVRNCTH